MCIFINHEKSGRAATRQLSEIMGMSKHHISGLFILDWHFGFL